MLRVDKLQKSFGDFKAVNGANLSNANLNGANLSGVYLRCADLRNARLSGAIFDESTIMPNGKEWKPD